MARIDIRSVLMRAMTLATVVLTIAACGTTPPVTTTTTTVAATTTTNETPTPTAGEQVDMRLSSRAFADGTPIPVKHTCDGDDVSPRLEISGIPASAVSLVLIVDDPDAPVGVWDHWVEYDIEVTGSEMALAEGVTGAGVSGLNSWNLTGYGGPCPPPGAPHRYFFTVYALDSLLLIPEGVDSDGVRTAMEGSVVAAASTMGTYER